MSNPITKNSTASDQAMDVLSASSQAKADLRQKNSPKDGLSREKSFQSAESSSEIFYTPPKTANPSRKREVFMLLFILTLVAGGLFFLWKEIRKPVAELSVAKLVPFPEKIIETVAEEKPAASEKLTEETIPNPDEAPKNGAPIENENDFSFAILGDTQRFDETASGGGFQQAVASLKPKNPAFIVAMGDLLSSCDGLAKCEGNLNNWKKILGDFFAKTYVVMGNHDRTGKEKADTLWQRFFSLPENGPEGFNELVYSFDHKEAHFVVLNSAKPKENLINTAQRDWLEADLAKNTKKHIFVFFHEPAYPVKSKIDEGLDHNPKERDALWKILEKYSVTAVFSGHEHIQSHKKIGTVDQFIFGNTDSFDHELPAPNPNEFSHQGEGFGIVSVSDLTTKVEFFTVAGELLKSIVLEK